MRGRTLRWCDRARFTSGAAGRRGETGHGDNPRMHPNALLDLATDLKHFIQAYNALATEGYDLVYGTRLHRKSRVVGRTLKREITSRVFNWMLKIYLGTRFSDGMCGFKWLRREHLPPLMNGGAVSNGWFFSTELLAIAEWKGLKMCELPVHWTDDTSGSKVDIPRLAQQYIKAMQVLKKRKGR